MPYITSVLQYYVRRTRMRQVFTDLISEKKMKLIWVALFSGLRFICENFVLVKDACRKEACVFFACKHAFICTPYRHHGFSLLMLLLFPNFVWLEDCWIPFRYYLLKAAKMNLCLQIQDSGIRDMILHMIQLDPKKRLPCRSYLQKYESVVFPFYFSNFLHKFFADIVPIDSDARVRTILVSSSLWFPL